MNSKFFHLTILSRPFSHGVLTIHWTVLDLLFPSITFSFLVESLSVSYESLTYSFLRVLLTCILIQATKIPSYFHTLSFFLFLFFYYSNYFLCKHE